MHEQPIQITRVHNVCQFVKYDVFEGREVLRRAVSFKYVDQNVNAAIVVEKFFNILVYDVDAFWNLGCLTIFENLPK